MSAFETRWLEDLFLIQLLQISIVAIVSLVAIRLLRKRPHLCHAILLLALVKCLIPPVLPNPLSPLGELAISHLTSPKVEPTQSSVVSAQAGIRQSDSRSYTAQGSVERRRFTALPPIIEQPPNPKRARTGSAQRQLQTLPKENDSRYLSTGLVVFGLVGVLLFVLWEMAALWIQRRLRQSVDVEATETLRPLFEKTCLQQNVKRARFWVADTDIGPVAFGIFRPTVVIPLSILIDTSGRDLEILFSHEINHLRRRDAVTSLLQTLVVCCWWFNPLIWCLGKSLSKHREYCCDLETISRGNIGSSEYCRCLLNRICAPREAGIRFGLGISPFLETRQRMEVILQNQKSKRTGTPVSIRLLVAVLAVLVVPGAMVIGNGQAAPFEKNDDAGTGKVTDKKVSKLLTEEKAFYVRKTGSLVFPRHQQLNFRLSHR